jgi:hypothetical protein
MVISKQEILEAIRRLAAENAGTAPGSQTFQAATGIGKSDWFPMHWLRWGDAIRDAGCQPNVFGISFGPELLILKYVHLIRELQRFPIDGELLAKRKTDRNFPSPRSFQQLGSKSQRAAKVVEYCNTHPGFEDVIPFCDAVASLLGEAVEE